MQNWILPLSPAASEQQVGRKGAALGRLLAGGFPVPPGVCISTDAFQAAESADPDDLRLPAGLLEALCGAFPADARLAVRSSAVLEDHPDASLAGRYLTLLNVSGSQAVEEAILACWWSYLSAPTTRAEGGMAVLVQALLEAECAGVCFTVDPVRLRPDLLLVGAGWGLGAGVVNGSVPADTLRLRQIDLRVEESVIAEKHTALRPAGRGGTEPTPVAAELRGIPCLPEEWLERIGQFGLAIEQFFGAPQDIEWAIADGRLWILQSRPVTALPLETREAARYPISWTNEEEARNFWWLERARDGAGAPLLPAELDFMRINTTGGHDAVYFGGLDSTRWRKYVNGRVYSARAVSPHSAGHVRVYNAALRDQYERLAQEDISSWEHWGPEIVGATKRLAGFDAAGAGGRALADHLEDAIATATRHWMVHTMSGPRPIRSAALLELYAQISGQTEEDAAAEIPFLLAGSETIQTRLVEALYDLACLAAGDPEAAKAAALTPGSGGPAEGADPGSFAGGFRRLMNAYGDRLCYRPAAGYPVELPQTWREAPEHAWNLIAAYLPRAREGGPGPRQTRLETLRKAETGVEALCVKAIQDGICPELVEKFRRTLALARRNASYLDEHNHYIDQISEGQFIQALIYAGRWLAAQGCLPNSLDVFWLNADEVLAALELPAGSLEALLGERRAQYAGWLALIPPACLGLPDAGLNERPARAARPADNAARAEEDDGFSLRGEPASRGRAEGRARIVVGDILPKDLAAGDVVIAPYASLLLIPFLPAAGALVLDSGGPGDHFAITAREFGLPAICATLQATLRIPEGAWVSVDADAGLVRWALTRG